MSIRPNVITIATVCDNHYAVLLGVLLKSLEVNHSSGEPVDVYIVDDGLSLKNREKITASVSSPLFSLKWLKLQEVVHSGRDLPLDNSSFPLNVYARLFIPHALSDGVEKLIYLDVDMVNVKDISELWKADLCGRIVAGVPDRSEKVSSSWGGIANYKELGLNSNTTYFNSGLLVIDVKKWIDGHIASRVVKCVNENKQYAGFPDQYGLNVVLAGQWLELDRRWNCYSVLEEKDPYIIHFIGIKPIYSSYKYNAVYKDLFFRYLGMTPWAGFRTKHHFVRLIKKAYNKLIKRILLASKS